MDIEGAGGYHAAVGGPSRGAATLLLASALLGAGAASSCGGPPSTIPAGPHPVAVEVPQPGSPGPAVESAPEDACPSAEAHIAVTACPEGPVPTIEQLRHAERMGDEDRRWIGLYPYTHRRGESIKLMGTIKPLAGRTLTTWEARLVELALTAACHGGTAPGKSGDVFTGREALDFAGRAYFDASRWEEAAAAFHLVATERRHESSPHSALFALEALEALAWRDDREACKQALRERAALYESIFCGDEEVAEDEICQEMRRWTSAPP